MSEENLMDVAPQNNEGVTADTQPQPLAQADGQAALLTSEAAQAEPEKPVGAPEKYELKAPEGRELDPDFTGKFEGAAKEANLTNEQAQLLLEKMGPVLDQRMEDRIQNLNAEWSEASRADKEFGGDNLDENIAIAKKGFESFASDELKALIYDPKVQFGSHPEFIRYFYRVGKAMSEDTLVNGGKGPAPKDKTIAQQMYPNMNP